MRINVNNKEMETKARLLSDLALELALPPQGVAVAVNNRMVPRTEWESVALAEGMSVVVVRAACGG